MKLELQNSIIRQIEIKYLITFLCVAKEQSFSKASTMLCITQPAVSQHIKKVETFLSCKLFIRDSGFKLSPSGKILFRHAKKIIETHNEMLEELECYKMGSNIKIALSNSLPSDLVDDIAKILSSVVDTNLIISRDTYHEPNMMSEYDLAIGLTNASNVSSQSIIDKKSFHIFRNPIGVDFIESKLPECSQSLFVECGKTLN